MNLKTILDIIVITCSFIGFLMLAKDIVLLSPQRMIESLWHYTPSGCPSLKHLSEEVKPKANAVFAALFILLALIIKVIEFFLDTNDLFIAEKSEAVILILCFVLTFALIFNIVRRVLYQCYMSWIKEHEVREILQRDFAGPGIWSNSYIIAKQINDLEITCKLYFDKERKTDESEINYFKRISEHVGWDIPTAIE